MGKSVIPLVVVCAAIAILSQTALAVDESFMTSRTVRIAPESLDAAVAIGVEPRFVADYGSFVWVELSSDDIRQLEQAGIAFVERPEPFAITLGEIRFDPLVAEPVLPQGWDQVSASEPDLHLVQFRGPMRADWLDDLRAQGLAIVQYVYPSTYIVWGRQAERDAALTLESVRWVGAFAPAYRVLPRWRLLPNTPQDVDLLVYAGTDTDAVFDALLALGASSRGRARLNQTFEHVGITLPGSAIQAAAQIPGVYSIQPVPTDGGLRGEMSDQISVGNYNGNNQAFPGYPDWLAAVGVDGGGVIIANVDGGINQNHPNLINRMLPCSGSTCGGGASSSHGTHTAGIMAADGTSGVRDSFGFLRGLGQAPGANLVEQVYSPWYNQPNGMLLLMTQSYTNGASLSGNSWGPSGSPLGYDDDTMQVDIGVRDAVPTAGGNQPLTFVLSFMNGNGGTSTQGTPDEAKNIFNVGSTKMQTSGGVQILQIDDLSTNTAHGPALDGRTIPHIVAPGCYVDSTTTSSYGLMCGTSMASPHVSGAVALFIEYYRNLPDYVTDPSPALIKAAFLPVAHDLAGHLDADGFTLGHPFDSKQGWGRMNLEAVVDPTVEVRYFDNPTIFDNTGEQWEMTVTPADPGQPMKFMLVWTDAPGHGLGGSTPAWNNNLDLVVQVGASTYLGNRFGSSGWSVTGGSADFRNNTEGVFLGPLAPSEATVRVVAANINSNGVPNFGDNTDQDFALVCYNCASFQDCNANGIDDLEDLANCSGDPACGDCNANSVPDGCEPDCDSDGLIDVCVLAGCAGEPGCADCNANAIPDGCDIDSGASTDCDTNGVPDSCDQAGCAGNSSCADCNGNGTLDGCDIAAGAPDSNGNATPDECEIESPTAAGEGSRFLRVTPQPAGLDIPVALWIGGDAADPDVSCMSLYVQTNGTLGTTAVYQTPAAWGTMHVHGDAIQPSTVYWFRAELGAGFQTPAVSGTSWKWGDADNNGDANFLDITLVVHGFQGDFSEAALEAVDLHPCVPDGEIDFSDINAAVRAFQDSPFAAMGCPEPCN